MKNQVNPGCMYYLVYGILYTLSLLPLRVLHLISDFAYFLIYHVMGYRKAVVMQNLAIAFPRKTEAERIAITKKFYRNFTDTFIETIKLLSASESFLRKHFTADLSVFDQLNAKGKKCQVHLGHNFNWEMGQLGVSQGVHQKVLVVYAPIENKIFDKIFRKMRSRFGAVLLPANDMKRSIIPWRDQPYILGLVADQNPRDTRKSVWANFFGKPAPFVTGPENGARIGNIPVVFCHITKSKRGYYTGHFSLAEENPASLPKGELTTRYIAFLERVIAESPDMWLWSHRRWKHEWKPEYGLLNAEQANKE